MNTEAIKTVEEYTKDFKKDYDKIVDYGDVYRTPQIENKSQNFEIFTLYTDRTPVTASNSSSVIIF